MPKPVKCKQCPFTAPGYDLLRDHFRVAHEDHFVAVQKWISDKTDERFLAAKKLAKEGMRGYKEEAEPIGIRKGPSHKS